VRSARRARPFLGSGAPGAATLSLVVLVGLLGFPVTPAGATNGGWVEPDDPDPPALLSPASGAASTDYPVLSWAPSANAVGYQVEVIRGEPGHPDVGFSCMRQTVHLAFSIDCGMAPGTYWWRLAATRKPGDTATDFSSYRRFVKLAGASDSPALLGPADGAALDLSTGLQPLSWTPVPGAYGYEIAYATDPAFGHLLNQGETGNVPFVHAPTEYLGQRVYWRVRATTATDASSHGPWSAARSLTVRWAAVPTLIAPADGETHSTIYLQWSPLAGATHYEIQVTDYPDVGFAAAGGTTVDRPWIEWDGPWPSDHYRWRVRGLGPFNETSGWSAVRTVVHDPGAGAMPVPPPLSLPAVTLTGPADGATIASLGLTPLDWQQIAGATGYQLQAVAAATPFSDPGPTGGLVGAPPALWFPNQAAGTDYHWRVRAQGPGGTFGPWSAGRAFSTASVLPPSLVAPADGATVSNDDLVLAWTGGPSASSTHVEWSQDPSFPDPSPSGPRPYADVFHGTRLAPGFVFQPGTWYWRVIASANGVLVTSAARSFVVEDHRGPAGRMWIGTGSWTDQPSVPIYSEAQDAVGGVTEFRLSPDGSSWETHPFPDAVSWSLTDPAHGGSAPGRRDIWIGWKDESGNWSDPVHGWIWYLVPPPADLNWPETRPPTVSVARTGIGPSVPLTIAWSASDLSGSPIVGFELQESVEGSAYAPVPLASPTVTSTTRLVSSGPNRRYRVRATDAPGNLGRWAYSPDVRVGVVQNSSSAIRYAGTWTTVRGSTWFGGSVRTASRSGAKATLKFTGQGIAWVAKLGPTRGRAWVYLDGKHVATVDLSAARTGRPRVVYARQWTSAGTHTITVKLIGPASHPRVDVDAFVVMP
jgi:hypothetical protein